ncbi:type 1 glutamine amidotransferase [Solimonas soli]|uniref:type 1 glutamine amidotransferase n=1 Tax=Solimonas soli TaxID=413479 RepID=UPI000486B248|nr:type 1 glutamine amidotransferase [Solimonas soli]
MRLHWLQHADFEDLGCIAPALAAGGHTVTRTRLYAGETLPAVQAFDALIVMGGPMNIYEYPAHPWLRDEKAFIGASLAAGRRALGICLGAQLIADVLGAPVTRGAHQEIGWHALQLTEAGRQAPMFAGFPERFMAFHWHGDTFAIPAGARSLMASAACAHQAYALRTASGASVAAIQFHLEVTAANARVWFEQERPAPGRYVQAPEAILARLDDFAQNNRLMLRLLDNWLSDRA